MTKEAFLWVMGRDAAARTLVRATGRGFHDLTQELISLGFVQTDWDVDDVMWRYRVTQLGRDFREAHEATFDVEWALINGSDT